MTAQPVAAQGAAEAIPGHPPSRFVSLLLVLEIDSDNHGGSIVRVVLAMLPAAVAHIVGFPEVSAAVAALVVMMVVALLLALDAHIRHDHFRAVPHTHRVPAKVTTPVRDFAVESSCNSYVKVE